MAVEIGNMHSKLGFGLMRLPRKGLGIDIEQTKEMVDLFLQAGGTYFDTAYIYPGSEVATRKALVERYPRHRLAAVLDETDGRRRVAGRQRVDECRRA